VPMKSRTQECARVRPSRVSVCADSAAPSAFSLAELPGRARRLGQECPGSLYGEIFCQGGAARGPFHSLVRVSLFDLKARFFAPTHNHRGAGARRSGQGWRVSAPPQGLVLDGFEHGGTLGVVGQRSSEAADPF
jgi:hypothetical protein